MKRSQSYIAVPPGATIREQLRYRGMNQKEFAARMDMSEKHISKLINGEVQLTIDTARRLEMVLSVPAQFWCNLEAIYREKLAKVKEENEMEADIQIAKTIPYKEMAKYGWVEETSKPTERAVNLRKFFEVVNLQLLHGNLIPGIACRKLSETEKSDIALIAWAQKAKLEARTMETRPISIQRLKEKLPEIREMTTMEPEIFCTKLEKLLADCGIAIVFIPHIGGSFLHGATFLDGNKIVVGMTVRGKTADKFWFSLFHELGHILYGHIEKKDGTTKADEDAVDEFSANVLIPRQMYENFAKKNDFSKEAIMAFAQEIHIDPGIVVGRLQKEKRIEYSWYNELKQKYEIS